jgi:hypothetical protein
MRWTVTLALGLSLLLGGSASAQEPASPDAPTLPVSLERIRDGLKQDVTTSILGRADIPPDFKIQILEQQKIDTLLSTIEFGRPGPVPFGGAALYEQQRRAFNPVDRPLMQPYAAFSPGQLVEVSLTTLLFHYLGKAALKGVGTLRDNVRESAAQREVDLAIADFCAKRPDRSDIQLCNPEF